MSPSDLTPSDIAWARMLANKVAATLPPYVDADDLNGAAQEGMVEATLRFDESRGLRFRTFATQRVVGSINDMLRRDAFSSRTSRQLIRRIMSAEVALEHRLLRPVTLDEIAEYLGLTEKEREQYLSSDTRDEMPLDMFIPTAGSDEEFSLHDVLADTAATPLEGLLHEERRLAVSAALSGLRPNLRRAITLYFLEEMTLKEVGAALGVSESRASHLVRDGLEELRRVMRCKRLIGHQ